MELSSNRVKQKKNNKINLNREKKNKFYICQAHNTRYYIIYIHIFVYICVSTQCIHLTLKLIRVSYANFMSSPQISRHFLCAFNEKKNLIDSKVTTNKLNVIHVYMNLFIYGISYYLYMVNQVSEISTKTKTLTNRRTIKLLIRIMRNYC